MTAATIVVPQMTMIASASPPSVSGGPTGGVGSPSETDATTVTVQFGVAPYTYAWEKVSGGAVSAQSPTSATTKFTAASTAVPTDAVFRCLVTDSRGLTTYSDNVSAFLTT